MRPCQREQVCQVDVKFVLIPLKDSLVDLFLHTEILQNPDAYRFKTIGLSGDKITIQKYCDILSKHLVPKIFQVSANFPENDET